MSSFAVALIVLLAVSLAGFAAGGGFQRGRLAWIAVPLGASLAGAALYALEPAPAASGPSTAATQLSALTAPSAAPETPLTPSAHPSVDSGGVGKAGDLNDMAAKLAARLAKNPDDGPGWALLARAYAWMGRYSEADAAFARAAKLKVDDPNLQAEWDAARAKAAAGAPPAAAATAAAPGGAFISGTVSIAEPLQHTLHKTDTVFVFARAPGGGAPLAVKRFKAADLPSQFRLDDSDAMAPGRDLSSSAKVLLVARLSASGNAIQQPGDIETPALTVKPGASGITLEIGAAQ
jgi:tetratricopeptide (TPR) repeat protein